MRLPDLGRLVSQSGGLWGYLQSTTTERAKHHQNQRNVKSSQHWKYTFGHHQTSLDIRYIAVSWNLGVPRPSISPWKNMKDDNVCTILGSSILDSLGNAHSNTLKYLVLISALCIRGSAAALATSSLAEFGPFHTGLKRKVITPVVYMG